MNNIDIIKELKSLRFFDGLTDEELKPVSTKTIKRQYRRNSMLISEDGQCREFYIVNRGKVKIFKTSSRGREHIFYYALRGDTFGEMAIFGKSNCCISAITSSSSELLIINEKDLKELIHTIPAFSDIMLRHFSEKMEIMMKSIENLSFYNVPGRLARVLVEMVKKEGLDRNGKIIIKRDITIFEMASLIGTVREVVTRSLHRFQNEGLIKISRRQIEVLDLDGLKKF